MTPSVCRFPVRLFHHAILFRHRARPFPEKTKITRRRKEVRLPLHNQIVIPGCYPQVTVEQLEYLWKHFTAKEKDPAAGGGKEAEVGE